MITLTLQTKNDCHKSIKEYLEQNVTQALADKINNGVTVEKDGKTLINKKDLDGFWAYATKKAMETKENYVKNETVFGWAMHYFEEDDIQGKLYNPDGSEYKVASKPVQKTTTPIVVPKPQPKPQLSLFDLMTEEKPTATTVNEELDDKQETLSLKAQMAKYSQPDPLEDYDDEPTEEDIDDAMEELNAKQETIIETPKISPTYQKYLDLQEQYPNAIIAYRLGDFYEIIGENAKTIANELDLTLTGRDCGLPERVPMVGLPYHALNDYLNKIVDKGYTVAVADNTDTRIIEPKPKNVEEDCKHWIDDKTYVDNDGQIHSVDEDLTQEMELAKAFDKTALATLSEIFGNEIDLQ